MKRSTPLRRTPFKRTKAHEPSPLAYEASDIAEIRAAAIPRVMSLRRGVYAKASNEPNPAPKTQTPRNPAIMDMAKDRLCLLRVPGVCNGNPSTTVACHRNEGKGMGLKQSDAYTVWGCSACHEWLDRGTAPREIKRARFMLAHLDQVIEFRRIANDMSEPVRFRRAADWALEILNATPKGNR